jgi:hypothetical protein
MASESKKKQKPRNYQSISISVPPELERPINVMAAKLRMSRSQFMCWATEQYMTSQGLPIDPTAPEIANGKLPPRIRRGRRSGKP